MRYRILGSCVTRDAFEYATAPDVRVERYFARSSIASAFSGKPFTGVDTSSIQSPFQRRIVEWDLSKEFEATAAKGGYDFVVLDLIDERFDLVRSPDGSLGTRSAELLKIGGIDQGVTRIASGSDDFLDLWITGWRRFLALVDATVGRQRVVLHQARWAQVTESGEPFAAHSAASITRANGFLGRLYRIIHADLPPEQTIVPDAALVVGADEHRWGPSPFHYTDEYYRWFVEELAARCEDTNERS